MSHMFFEMNALKLDLIEENDIIVTCKSDGVIYFWKYSVDV
jgi:hypothetical protein